MANGHSLVSTVAVGLAYAFIGGSAARRIHLPPLVGYLIAGIAVSPFTPGFVADTTLAPQLAEIGVILLMFGVGLHFSIRDLWKVKSIAVPGAVCQIVTATALGLGMTVKWGWPIASGLVFGLALSVASTVVLLRALEERNLLKTEDGRIAVGWLIVEDLVMVLALVLIPALATPAGAADTQARSLLAAIGITLLKVLAFGMIILIGGRWVFPRLLDWTHASGSRELFTLAITTLSLGVGYVASELFHVSFALGAFFAGLVVHESDLSDRVNRELGPLQDVFTALFFVSVGMLFDPTVLFAKPLEVLGVVATILIGKSAIAYTIVRGLGHSVGTAMTVSASLAQIGEFSFILAGLGKEIGLLTDEAQSLLVAGALLSITLNSPAFAVSQRLSGHSRSSNESPRENL